MMAETAAAGRGETAPRAALARVEREEEAAPLGMGLVAGKRAVAAGAVTLERFDLDDIGPQSRQERAAVRRGDKLAQLDDPEAGKRSGVHAVRRGRTSVAWPAAVTSPRWFTAVRSSVTSPRFSTTALAATRPRHHVVSPMRLWQTAV